MNTPSRRLRFVRQAAGLGELGGSTMWHQVNDFGWHRVQQSPNWSVLPEDARLTSIVKTDMVTLVGAPAAAPAPPVAAAPVAAVATATVAPVDDGDDEL